MVKKKLFVALCAVVALLSLSSYTVLGLEPGETPATTSAALPATTSEAVSSNATSEAVSSNATSGAVSSNSTSEAVSSNATSEAVSSNATSDVVSSDVTSAAEEGERLSRAPQAAGIIQVATELELREAVGYSTGAVTIELTADITMTDPYPNHPGGQPPPYPAMWEHQNASERASLYIASGKDITLIGNYKIIATGTTTIRLNGKLTLDGPTITHQAGVQGAGIRVGVLTSTNALTQPRAELLFKSGLVCGNTTFGIVVANGDVLMTGGEIYGNGVFGSADTCGIAVGGNGWNLPDAQQYGGTVIIEGGSIHDNAGRNGAGIHVSGNSHVSLKVKGGAIYNNTSSGLGGGIFVASSLANIEMSGGNIYGNTAPYGGGIFSYNNLNISGGEIYGNSAGEGGGVYCYASAQRNATLTVSGTAKIRDNTAYIAGKSSYGGGICVSKASNSPYLARLNISGGEISGNNATYGGGVYAASSGIIMMSDGAMYDNEADYGGGIFANNCTTTLSGGEIRNNTAAGSGGGVLVNGGTLDVSAGTFDGNTAMYGGGIYNAGALNVTGGTICNNSSTNPYGSANASGGGIYTESYSQLTVGENVEFSGNTANKLTQLLETDADFATYEQKISVPDGQWSVAGVMYGYNNYDINYLGSELIIVTVTFDYNDGRGVYTGVTTSNGADGLGGLMPIAPQRAGYSFLGWNMSPSGTGADFGTATPVTGNITVYAQWSAITTVTSGTAASSASSSAVTSGTAASSGTSSAVTSGTAASSSAATGETTVSFGSSSTGNSLRVIGGADVPLIGGDAHWALVNLILTVAGAVIALITLISFFVRKKEDEEEDENGEETVVREYRKRGLLKALSALIAALSIIVFIITENMRLPMVLADKWTILMAVLLLAQGLVTIVARRRKKEDGGNYDAEN